MSQIEEVKKILDKDRDNTRVNYNGVCYFKIFPTSIDAFAQQICQLSPKSPDNPDGYKPKPDESRLIEVSLEEAEKCRGWASQRKKFIEAKVKAQRDLTASIKEAEIAEIGKRIMEGIDTAIGAYESTCEALLKQKEAECQARVERILEKVERSSHPMNTNMYGISLSKQEWQTLKEQEGIKDGI